MGTLPTPDSDQSTQGRPLDTQEQTFAAIAEGYADFEAGRIRLFEEADEEFRNRCGLPDDW